MTNNDTNEGEGKPSPFFAFYDMANEKKNANQSSHTACSGAGSENRERGRRTYL